MFCILCFDVMQEVSSQDKLSHLRVNKLCLGSLMKILRMALWSSIQYSQAAQIHVDI